MWNFEVIGVVVVNINIFFFSDVSKQALFGFIFSIK